MQTIPENVATIIDAMGLVQKISVASSQTTFASVASTFFTMAVNEGGKQSTRIDIVFDTYREISIKNVDRGIRGEVQGVEEVSQSSEEQNQLDSIFLQTSSRKRNTRKFCNAKDRFFSFQAKRNAGRSQ